MFLGFFGGGRSRETESTQAWEKEDLLGGPAMQDAPLGVPEISKEAEGVPASEPVTDKPVLENSGVAESSLLPASPIVDAAPKEVMSDVPLSIAPDVVTQPEPVISAPELPVMAPVESPVVQPEVKSEPEILKSPDNKSVAHDFVDRMIKLDLQNAA